MARNFEGAYPMPADLEPTQEIAMDNLGPLYGKNGEFKDAFSGKIGVATPDDHAALIELHNLNFDYFYENAQPGAPEDCGDERPATTLVDAMLRQLGPQNMGGSSTNALVWGLTAGRSEPHLRVIAGLNAAYNKADVDYRLGGHTAEGAHGLNCGCAAIDLIPDVTAVIIDPSKREAQLHLTAALLGPEWFDEEAYKSNIMRYRDLYKRLGRYLPPDYQHASLDLMRKLSPDIEPVNQRVGEHKGLAVIANNVAGTRLSQDILAVTPTATGRPVEAFGVDVWYAIDLAEQLFPNDEIAQKEFAVGRIMYDVGALLAITDGSIDLMLRHS